MQKDYARGYSEAPILKKVNLWLGVFLTLLLPLGAQAIDLAGTPNSHDPATLIEDNGRYFHFTTGDGIWYSYSDDLVNWTPGPSTVFPLGTWPSWINQEVNNFGGQFWAPDVIYMNGYYYLYYSVSSFGTSKSAIGVVRTASLRNPNWQDLGKVVDSEGGSNEVNAIDAGLFRDDDGRVYMTYGSWFGGIAVVEINQSTGKTIGSPQWIYGGGHQSIEAPYIIKEGNYYYLFVNRGTCCQGLNSTYYIEVGRSTSIWGGYSGFRTVLSSSGKYVGPGHVGLLEQGDCQYVSTHYYDGSDNGVAKLDILKMTWSGGWPSFTRNFSFGQSCAPTCSPSSITPYAQVDGGTWSQSGSVTVNTGQTVKFGPHPTASGSWSWSGPSGFSSGSREITINNIAPSQGGNYVATFTNGCGAQSSYTFSISVNGGSGTGVSDGVYYIVNKGSGTAWDSWGCTGGEGEAIAQANYGGYPCQKWQITETSSGEYSIASTITGNVADISGCSSSTGALIQLWSDWGGACQRFTITATGDGDGSVYIRTVNSNKAVGLPEYAGAGQQLQTQDVNGSNWQKWNLNYLSSSRAEEESTAIVAEDFTFAVFPNPAQGVATVQFQLPITQAVSGGLYDLQGREVSRFAQGTLAAGSHQVPLSVQNLETGVYLVRLQTGQTTYTQRLLVE